MRWRPCCTPMSSPERPAAHLTLASSLLSIVASHLVILTLALFLGIGLRLAGFWGGDEASLVTGSVGGGDRPASPTAASEAALTASPQREAETPSQQATAEEGAGDPAVKARPEKPRPRLIGGSLPIHGADQEPSSDGSIAGSSDGFRPEAYAPQLSFEPSREELIQDARRAFWNGDFEGAEAAYVTILTLHPGDADTFGELGNLYQSMGKPEQALDAYYEAAVRLKAVGEEEKLSKIIVLLEKSGDSRVASLRP